MRVRFLKPKAMGLYESLVPPGTESRAEPIATGWMLTDLGVPITIYQCQFDRGAIEIIGDDDEGTD